MTAIIERIELILSFSHIYREKLLTLKDFEITSDQGIIWYEYYQ